MCNDSFIDSPLGKAAMEYAEQVYSSSFNCGEFTIKTNPEMREELIQFHMEPVYGKVFPDNVIEDCIIMDSPHNQIEDDLITSFHNEDLSCDEVDYDLPIIHEGMSRDDAELMVDNSVYVWLCNYKGEGEGFTLKEFAENLQTYHGKWNYS